MIYIIDTADLEKIRYYTEFFPIDGVTTNPSIIAREKTDFKKLLCDIRAIIGPDKMLHVQAVGKDADTIVREAKAIYKVVGGRFYIKIPISPEGLKAMEALRDTEIGITATAIFTPQQAMLAAKAGAAFVAPYVNRLDNIIGDGSGVAARIAEELAYYKLPCKVLSASFESAEQVERAAMAGCHAVTVSPEIFDLLVSHPMTDAAIAGFDRDWTNAYGRKTTEDLL